MKRAVMLAVVVWCGATSGALAAGPTVTLERVLGGPGQDLCSGMVVDANGNGILAGQSKSFEDTTTADMVAIKVSPKGEVLWAKNYGTPGADVSRNYIDGEYGGPSRTVAMGADGSVYIGARSHPDRNEPFMALLFKLAPDGTLAWSKLWKVHQKNQMNAAAQADAVAVAGDRVFVTGMTGAGQTSEEGFIFVAIHDAKTGDVKDLLAVDPSPTYNDRAFAIVATPKGDAVYVAGWNGRTARGHLLKFNVANDKLALAWAKEIPWKERASTVSDLDLDAAGNVYLAGDIHGTQTWLEVLKLDPAGKFVWGRQWNAGVRNDKNNTRLVRVLGDKLLVAGRVAFGGSNTDADTFYGDGALWMLDLNGKTLWERYHFTGTQQDLLAMDSITGAGVFGKQLVLGGWIHPYVANLKGEWRNPEDFKTLQHPITEVGADKMPLKDLEDVKTINLTATASIKNGADQKDLKFTDIKDRVKIGPAAEMSKEAASTQCYFWVMDGAL